MVEFLKNVKSERAINELCLPPRPATQAVLNAPGPTSIPMSRIYLVEDGVDGINVRCSDSKEFLSMYLPTGREVLEKTLRDSGFAPKSDEKQACYQPVMKLFSGLDLEPTNELLIAQPKPLT